jgi:undecaprenyl phosphate N,N'-diacetylbacillosamine 1-phosphate transferase
MTNEHIPCGPYEKYIKRPLDCFLATGAIVLLSPVMAGIALLVKKKLGSPVLFVQIRPGKNEKLFKLYKFRTMTEERDAEGNLLPDEERLTPFGRALRESSLDELPELFNIIKGDMAIIGPRPQLVEDMVFMTPEQRKRHDVRQGLTGLAQCNGRNSLSWEQRFQYDLQYVNHITFMEDVKIFWKTVVKVLAREGISETGRATTLELGDYLLCQGKVDRTTYERKKAQARELVQSAEKSSCRKAFQFDRKKGSRTLYAGKPREES